MEGFSFTALPTDNLLHRYFYMFVLETTEDLAFSVSKKGKCNNWMSFLSNHLALGQFQRTGNVRSLLKQLLHRGP